MLEALGIALRVGGGHSLGGLTPTLAVGHFALASLLVPGSPGRPCRRGHCGGGISAVTPPDIALTLIDR